MRPNNFSHFPNSFLNSQPSRDFKESHSIWKSDSCEVFYTEIHEKVYGVPLKFSSPVFSHLLNGSKNIQLEDINTVKFNKKQTLILPKNSVLEIDFPTSTLNHPTQCTTLAIDPDYLKEKTQFLNETTPKLHNEWQLNIQSLSLMESETIDKLFHKITFDLLDHHIDIPLNWEAIQLEQLLLSMMQHQSREQHSSNQKNPSVMQSLVTFIKENPEKSGNLNQLCQQACMSPSTLYRYFKRELGISPIEFIIQQKLSKAKSILKSSFLPIKEVSYLSGFEDSNYFIRLFKKHEGITPKQYQQLLSKDC